MKSLKTTLFALAVLSLAACSATIDGGSGSVPDLFGDMTSKVEGPALQGRYESECTRTSGGYRVLTLDFTGQAVNRESRMFADSSCISEIKKDVLGGRYRYLAQMTTTDYRVEYRFANEKGEVQTREETIRWTGDSLWVSAYQNLPTETWIQLRVWTEPLPARSITWPKLRVLNLRGDGSYDVICEGGQREIVTGLDLSTGNLCPKITTGRDLNVTSLQRREDGRFDVICADLRRLIATEDELLNRRICPKVYSRIVLADGEYVATSGNTSFYDQRVRAVVVDGQMSQISLTTIGSSWSATLSCQGEVCSGTAASGDAVRLTVLSTGSYRFNNVQKEAVFTKR